MKRFLTVAALFAFSTTASAAPHLKKNVALATDCAAYSLEHGNGNFHHNPKTDECIWYTGYDHVDTDLDGLADHVERWIGTDPFVSDTDGDGVNDWAELTGESDPLNVEDTVVVTEEAVIIRFR